MKGEVFSFLHYFSLYSFFYFVLVLIFVITMLNNISPPPLSPSAYIYIYTHKNLQRLVQQSPEVKAVLETHIYIHINKAT